MRPVRRVVGILVLLLVAAVVNVGVAWWLMSKAVLAGTPTIPPTILACSLGVWPEPAVGWPAPHVGTVSCAAFDSVTYAVRAAKTPTGFVSARANPEVSRSWHEIRVGVPFRCLKHRTRQENWHVPIPVGHIPAARVDEGIALGVLPCRPIWAGFIANTILFAIPLFIVGWLLDRFGRWLAPQRRIWIARGMCGACGYDRSGLVSDVVCPECGAAGKT